MSLSEFTKLSIAFKKLIARDYSTTDKAWYEEEPGGGFNVHAEEVWAEEVPVTPPAATTSVIKVYTDVADGAIELTEDTTVSGSRGWFAEDGSRIGDIVSAKYGQSYTPRIFQDNGSGTGKGSQILTTNAADWFFDEVSGYLAFQDSTSGFLKPIWLEAYRYIGEKVFDQLGGGVTDRTEGEFDCAASLTVAQLVQMDVTNNRVVLASNSGAAIGPVMGVSMSKPTSTTCVVRFSGECAVFAGLVAGTIYYLGVNGAITTAPLEGASTIHQQLGVAKNASTLVLERGEAIFN